jgi:hypothetical protein
MYDTLRAAPGLHQQACCFERLDMDVQAGEPHQGRSCTTPSARRQGLHQQACRFERLDMDVQSGELHQGWSFATALICLVA